MYNEWRQSFKGRIWSTQQAQASEYLEHLSDLDCNMEMNQWVL